MATTYNIPKRSLTWLITGCSSGFGLSLARYVQAGGHKLIASSRNPGKTPELVKEVEGKGGKWIQLDVSSPDCAETIDKLESSGDQIDVLVNNAGFSYFATIEQFSEQEVREQMETLFFGPLALIRAAIPHMRKRKFGSIVNFSSGASLDGNPSMGVYAGAKAGIDAMSKVLNKEVAAFNIRILTVVLGTFNTNMANAASFSKTPMHDDYKGSFAETMINAISGGKFQGQGDKDKAMKIVYEVVIGEGAGAGKEGEKFLPMGADMVQRVEGQLAYYNHALETFGSDAKSVAREQK